MTKVPCTVGLLFGGQSGEHEVSITSARAIAAGLATHSQYRVRPFYLSRAGLWCSERLSQGVLEGKPLAAADLPTEFALPEHTGAVDVWVPVLHGPNGEDGTVQGLLTLMQKPFVGNGVLAAAVGMDKILMKAVFAQAGLAQVKFVALTRRQWQEDGADWCAHVEERLGYPCFVKPSNLGSSVGISKVRDRAQLQLAIATALTFDHRCIVEQGVVARELECAVLGNDDPKASVVGEITYSSDFYDYETKYTSGRAQLHIPADIPVEVTEAVQHMALRAFRAIAGRGLARVDFFYVPETATILVNEINTFPGFTATSMYPKLWEASGITFPELCDRLIQLAQES